MPPVRPPFSDVVDAVREQTALLLGLTISYSDEDWAAATSLTGWSRSHVAAHLAEGARGMVRVIRSLHSGIPRRMYDSEAANQRAIELGALADGLDLQIRLDTSASELQAELAALEDDDRLVSLRAGYQVPAHDIPLARLSEVVLHHVDMGCILEESDLVPGIAEALLAFHVERIGHRDDYPPLRLVADEGYIGSVGRPGATTGMHGPSADLLVWLTRGIETPRLYRAE
ncbi:maleylpyruvate isomerase family mycothiol-dependent enzyme [Tessaracoccus defluvii]|uniref:Maleylpyruvate isomerase family mycothiol-dependent enzyme n=1 Tax=Tessaracoccus defluvii TaxID=1285901 RepID=A0A7H0H7C0_9ACTN|nr:maleylpyruvate isomerase family mycothiol-dependent enzyme [Tessaracoccus defluvii]QNP56436.1 maleylpyruvate isomerase family mycothiol-dependent enzyme [Tessaracoccus defluvii]